MGVDEAHTWCWCAWQTQQLCSHPLCLLSLQQLHWSCAAAAGRGHGILILKIDPQPVWDPFWESLLRNEVRASVSIPKSKNIFEYGKLAIAELWFAQAGMQSWPKATPTLGRILNFCLCFDDAERKKRFFKSLLLFF